jgi:endonuclease/exonuclease/phosphatase family metal-dependent hydrolase
MGHILRVASYNLRDFKDDAQAAARVVRAIDPDVLCLQEVPRHLLSGHRVAAFAGRCGLYWSAGHRGSGGTTVMSSLRVDVTGTQHRPLKVARFQRQRGYAVSQVRLPGHRAVTFVSMHLSLDAGERARHAASVLKALTGAEPLVLAGDLNEGPDRLAWKTIAGRLRAATGDAPTYPADNPRHRLDVIFVSPALPVMATGPHDAVELDPTDLVAATDHLPVWVDLDLSGLVLS